ncbi:MAG: hypothetical protein ABI934_05495 [Actinomycetota bacterium]
MNLFQSLADIATARLTGAHIAFAGRTRRTADRDRGDVPGWVLITLMTAGLVTILWRLAGDQLSALFTQAMGSVTGP